MLPYEESVYFTVYFYNAVIEFVYFVIIHIQNNGPKHIAEIQKHLKFFKTEVDKFVNSFDGKNKKEKCSNMLCTATPVFYTTNNVLYLKENFTDFKNIIFEDLIINKTIDIIFRGVSDIEKICENLNTCSVIKMDKNVFLSFLKRYPYFHINKNEAIIVLQCKNLLSFHNHTYETVVQYFLNILQNSYVIRYESIKFHGQFVSYHRIQSCLSIFCILNSCDIFKCENSNVFLLKKLIKKDTPKQQLNINYSETDLSDPSSSLTLFVYQTLGPKIFKWTGHVSQLMENGGLIFCTVNFKDNVQEMFVVYFHKRALKYIGDIYNLSEHVAFQDVVEFDAEFCVGAAGRYYQATQVSVIKRHYSNNSFKTEIDLEEYSKSISQQYFLQISKSNLQPVCPFNFNTLRTPSLSTPYVKNHIPTNYDEFVSFLKNSLNLSFSEQVGKSNNTQKVVMPAVFEELHYDSSTPDFDVNGKNKSEFNNASIQKKIEAVQNCLNVTVKEDKVFSSTQHKEGLDFNDTYRSNALSFIKTENDNNTLGFEDFSIFTYSSTKSMPESLTQKMLMPVVNEKSHSEYSMPDSEVNSKKESEFNDASIKKTIEAMKNCLNVKENKTFSSIQHKKELDFNETYVSNALSFIKTENDNNNFSFGDSLIFTDSATEFTMSEPEKTVTDSNEIKQSILETKNKLLFKKDSNENLNKYLHDSKNIFNDNLDLGNNQIQNFLILKYTFFFGEIDLLTKEGGIINCVCDTTIFTVYFHYKSVFTLNGHSNPKNMSRFDKVLLFSPNIKEDTYPVAILVYLLKDNEAILIQKHNLSSEDFIIKYFLPKIKSKQKNLTFDYELCPNLRFDVPFEANSNKVRDIRMKYYKLIKSLNKIYTFDQKFLKKFSSSLITIKKNLKLNCITYTTLFPFIVWKTLSFKCRRKYKDLSKFASRNSAKDLPINGFTVKLNEWNEAKMNLDNKSTTLSKSKSETDLKLCMKLKKIIQNDQIYNSCSSLSSFMSCESKVLSDDRFYSCESSINMSDGEERTFKLPFTGSLLNKNSFSESEISKITATDFSFKTRAPILNESIDSSQNSISDFTKKSKHKCLNKRYSFEDKALHFNSLPKLKKTKVRRKKHSFKFLDSLILSPKLVVKTASICMMTNSYLFLTPINYEKELFCFPLKSVPAELKLVLQINSIVEITYIPFKPLNMSHLLFLKTQPDFKCV